MEKDRGLDGSKILRGYLVIWWVDFGIVFGLVFGWKRIGDYEEVSDCLVGNFHFLLDGFSRLLTPKAGGEAVLGGLVP
jgi:hypothetical protein